MSQKRNEGATYRARSELARELTEVWHTRFHSRWPVVAAYTDIGQPVTFYSPDHPAVLTPDEPWSSGLTSLEEAKRSGFIGICEAGDWKLEKCEAWMKTHAANGERMVITTRRFFLGMPGAASLERLSSCRRPNRLTIRISREQQMDIDLTGKTALVTGSTRGIGLATAIGLAQMGAEVIVNGREHAAVTEAMAKVRQAAPAAKVHAAAFDLGSAEGCAALIGAIPRCRHSGQQSRHLRAEGFFDIEDADWTRMFEVNVMSGVRLTRHYLKRMLDDKDWGRVVFVSSESGIFIPKEMVHYGFSKSAQLVIARGAAELTKGTNVTVNSVLPGPTWVEMAPVRLAARAKAHGHHGRRSRRAHLHRAPAGLAAAALRAAGRDRQPDLLRLLESIQRHQRRRAARRRRHRHQSVLSGSFAP